ncbi:MAG: MBL fold metallo-hydrolase [Candidatus Nezhaarchaeales archaeon]
MTILTLLGTGASEGIPALNCRCKSCQEARVMPSARRMPTSILVLSKINYLIDAGFDVMDRLGDFDISFVLLTHWHPDHSAGLFRLRWSVKPVTVYAPEGGLNSEIKREPRNLQIKFIKPYQEFKIEDIKITAIPLSHNIESLGYLIDDGGSRIAILFDGKGLAEREIEIVRNMEVNLALIDATYAPNSYSLYHNNVDEALDIGYKIKAERIVLTHIAHHNMPFTELTSYIRKFRDALLAYDNMTLNA